jgi:hypothetical protein
LGSMRSLVLGGGHSFAGHQGISRDAILPPSDLNTN